MSEAEKSAIRARRVRQLTEGSFPVPGLVPGMIEQGNIDLNGRPMVRNQDGSISTVRSMGVNIDGEELLIPTVSPDGKILSDEDAIKLYRLKKQHLGKFNSPEMSDEYARKLHLEQEQLYKD